MAKENILNFGVWSVLALFVILLGYTGRDDSHITYFVADSIAGGNGIVNYNGDLIEQSSTLAFSYLLAGLSYALEMRAADIGFAVSLSIYFLCMLVGMKIARECGIGTAYGALVFLAPPALYWALAGMESSLYLLLLLCMVYSWWKGMNENTLGANLATGIFSCLATLTRPEAIIVIPVAAIILAAISARQRQCLRILYYVVGFSLFAIVFRKAIGLDVFPNPVSAKQDLEFLERFRSGANYFRATFDGMPATSMIFAYSFVLTGWSLFRSRRIGDDVLLPGILVAFTFTIGLFALTSGGDWMEAGRFLSAAFVLQFMAALLVLPRKYLGVASAVVLLGFIIDTSNLVKKEFGGIPLFWKFEYEAQNYRPARVDFQNAVHARDLSFIDHFIGVLAEDERHGLTIASIQAGMVPYYLVQESDKDIEFVDLAGLATRHIVNCRGQGGTWYDPYKNKDMERLQDCVGVRFDYVFDLDSAGWPRLQGLVELGCIEVIREDVTVASASWKKPYEWQQFLVKCTPATAVSAG